MRIMIFGSSGYIGSSLAAEAQRRHHEWVRAERTHSPLGLSSMLGVCHPDVVINAAAFITKPSVLMAEQHKEQTIQGNVVWPGRLADVCGFHGIPLLHLSTGCLWKQSKPEPYEEDDLPELTLDNPVSSFYTATKEMAERAVMNYDHTWICRLRLPFDEKDHPRNFLSKLIAFEDLHEFGCPQSMSHRSDLADMIFQIVERRLPYGIYHCTNPGGMRISEIAHRLMETIAPGKRWNVITPLEPNPQSYCLLSSYKLQKHGVQIRDLKEAVESAIQHWSTYV